MPKRIAPLSEVKVRSAKQLEKPYKLYDGGGLYLLVTPSGGKLWHFKYRADGKEKKLTFGSYPDVSLTTARDKRDEARRLIASGIDPGEAKKKQQELDEITRLTFSEIALEWHASKRSEWSESHAQKLLRRLELDVFPYIGNKPIAEIRTPELATILERVAIRTLETAHRLKIACDMVFRYAVLKGKCEQNPAASLLGLLPTVKPKHMAAPTDPKKVAELLKAIDGYSGAFVTKCALRLAPLLFARPGELRKAEWAEFSLDAADGAVPEWNIPGSKMKMKKPHLVPLSLQAVEILLQLRKVTGNGKYVFVGHRSPDRCMSENTVNQALRSMGFTGEEIVGHGFRAMARTMLHEILKFNPDAIEAQLAHAVPDRLGAAYNRTQHIEERKEMMQAWADYLDTLKARASGGALQEEQG